MTIHPKDPAVSNSGDLASEGRKLVYNYHQLEALLAQLVTACAAGAREEVTRLWQTFEFGLRRHLKQEEALFFKALHVIDQAEVKRLTDEHLEIRRQLFELGLCVELQIVRVDALRKFSELLRRHAHGRLRFRMPESARAGSASCS